jgi:predicted nucleic acid-binding protein
VEYLLETPRGQRAAATLEADERIAPALLDAEVLSVVRLAVLAHGLDPADARSVLARLVAWPVQRVLHGPYVERAFELRENFSAYDALYVAVAEAHGAVLVTCDGRLSRAPRLSSVEIRNIA